MGKSRKDPGPWPGKQSGKIDSFPKGIPKNKWDAQKQKSGKAVSTYDERIGSSEAIGNYIPIERSKRHFQFGMKMSPSYPQYFVLYYKKGGRDIVSRDVASSIVEAFNESLPYWYEEAFVPGIKIRPCGRF